MYCITNDTFTAPPQQPALTKSKPAMADLDVSHNLTLCGRCECVAPLSQYLHHVVREIASRKIQSQNGMRQRVALVDGNSMAAKRAWVVRMQEDQQVATTVMNRARLAAAAIVKHTSHHHPNPRRGQ